MVQKEKRITFWCFLCLRILPVTERVMVKKKWAYLECCKQCERNHDREEETKIAKGLAKKLTDEFNS